MNIEEFRKFCIEKPGVSEEFPFDSETLVFKVMGKMFALTNVELFESINLKCDPELAEQLREQYEAVQPGYHMNKKHWNTVYLNQGIGDNLLKGWIDHSYDLIVEKLPKTLRNKL